MSTSFTQVFGGTTIYPSDVSYLALPLTGNISLEWPLEATTGNNVVARIIDVTPTGAFTITMPDAMSVGVGQTVLFNNLGPNTILVNSASGAAILSIEAGQQWQCYLIDNTTVGGVWRTFRYGAAVAQAQAAALAGAGLIASGSTLAQNYDVSDFSVTPYNSTTADRSRVFVWTGGLGTFNLPTAVAAGDGWFVQLRNGGQGDLTVDPAGSELINAAFTLLLQPGDSAVLVSDGVQWYTIGLGQQAVFAFDYTTIAVTGGTYTLTGSELNRIAYKFTGTLTSNVEIVVPATVQQYWVNNATTGAFTLGVKTASGTATLVDQGSTAILYCDGTEIISATTSAAFAGILPVTQGGTGATTASGARTNLGATGIGTALFTATTAASARSTISAAASGANSDITSITGLTTPLTVAQGGTGSATAGAARTALGATTVGGNVFTLTNPSAVTFLRFNADNTVSALDAATFRSAISAAASGANTDITALDQDVTITATGTIAADTLGYRGLPQNSQTSAYTLVLADAGKHISITTGGVIIPANGTTAFPVGTAIVVFNNSGSNQTISITTDTLRQAGTANTGSRTLAQYGLATCVKVASTTWVISGAGVS